MTGGPRLRPYAPSLLLMLTADALALFVLFVSGAGRDVIILVALVLLAGQLAAIVAEALRKQPFWRQLADATRSDHALMASEMIDEPTFSEGRIAYGALRSVSKAANDEVAAYHRQAIDYREYIETWVHEARTPLAAAHLTIDNLSDALGAACGPDDASHGRRIPDDALVMSKLSQIDRELQRVEDYIDQTLFYARSETLEQDYLIRGYLVQDVVNAALKANAATLIQAHMTPVCEHLDLTIFTDGKWIVFMLGQLIQNSVKYARSDADPTITFSAALCDQDTAHEAVRLAVSDNGRGVGAADLPRVFDKGFTGENGRSGKRSTGIGLYLVKRLCDKMGIEVRASSVEGDGFTVVFTFPTNRFRYLDLDGRPR